MAVQSGGPASRVFGALFLVIFVALCETRWGNNQSHEFHERTREDRQVKFVLLLVRISFSRTALQSCGT